MSKYDLPKVPLPSLGTQLMFLGPNSISISSATFARLRLTDSCHLQQDTHIHTDRSCNNGNNRPYLMILCCAWRCGLMNRIVKRQTFHRDWSWWHELGCETCTVTVMHDCSCLSLPHLHLHISNNDSIVVNKHHQITNICIILTSLKTESHWWRGVVVSDVRRMN